MLCLCLCLCRYGFFKNKRIVLYDTLINECSEDEVVAVLAHGEGATEAWICWLSWIFVECPPVW